MKVLLVGINAKYIHSNLAIRSLQYYAKESGYKVDIKEYTINQHLDYILAGIMEDKADIIAFSCYIWNVEYVRKLVTDIKKINNHITIILGGPEVGYNAEQVLNDNQAIDIIICGEGEESFIKVLGQIEAGHKALAAIEGIAFRQDEEILISPSRPPMSMDQLPFVYSDLTEFENRIIYYETSRGCPFNCSYCISSIEKGARLKSFDLVKDELQFFLDNQVMQVKFIDRTFNCNKGHAMRIWRYLDKHDNGYTNFHFEISADLLDDEMIDFLNTVREGIFQLEIGVQSTNKETISAINRKMDFDKLAENVIKIKAGNNIHLHLDLIAGLPYEDYNSFAKSFNDVYSLYPEQLQLGFLKVLSGAAMHIRAEVYGLKYRGYPPYEVLQTESISFKELTFLKMLEEVLEIYYNSGNYDSVIHYVESLFPTPFKMFERLATFFRDHNYFGKNHSKPTLCTAIKEFSMTIPLCKGDVVDELIKYDLYLQEKVKRFPSFLAYSAKMSQAVIDFYRDENNILTYLPALKGYTSKQISKMAHIESFKVDVIAYKASDYKNIQERETTLLFDYNNRDKMRHNARVHKIFLS